LATLEASFTAGHALTDIEGNLTGVFVCRRQNMSEFHSADDSDHVLEFDAKAWGLGEMREYIVKESVAQDG
jgi:hypothetical protein